MQETFMLPVVTEVNIRSVSKSATAFYERVFLRTHSWLFRFYPVLWPTLKGFSNVNLYLLPTLTGKIPRMSKKILFFFLWNKNFELIYIFLKLYQMCYCLIIKIIWVSIHCYWIFSVKSFERDKIQIVNAQNHNTGYCWQMILQSLTKSHHVFQSIQINERVQNFQHISN